MELISSKIISYRKFETDIDPANPTVKYNSIELLEAYGNKNKKEQMQDQVYRSKEIGEGPRLIVKWRKRITKKINMYDIYSQPYILDKAYHKYNRSIELYNEYIAAKNNQFKKNKSNINNAKLLLEKAKVQMTEVIETFASIEVEDKRASKSISRTIRKSEKLLKKIDKELDFLEIIRSK